MEKSDVPILLIDDDVTNLRTLTVILERAGYVVIGERDPRKAVERLKECNPGLVLLDIVMPEMDGYEVFELMKSVGNLSAPVIFVSVKGDVEDRIRAFQMGAVDFICKPFNKTEVLARVKAHYDLERFKRQLRESEKNYSVLVENVRDGIFIIDESNRIVFTNSCFESLLGMRKSQLIGEPLCNLAHENDADRVKAIYQDAQNPLNAGRMVERDWRVTRRDKSVIHMSCVCAPMEFSNQPCVLVTVRDLTERENLERQLVQSQKLEALGLMASGIAHDFNNILALINGYTELSMMEIKEDSSLHEKLSIVLDAGKSAVSLIKGLLAFSKSKNVEMSVFDAGQEIQRVVGFLKRGIPKQIDFQVSIPEEPLPIEGNGGQFQQILVNLCLNARDAMPSGGALEVVVSRSDIHDIPAHASGAARPGEYVTIKVRDEGVGINDHDLDKIFNPFFTTKEKGSGLGLAMVQRVVHSHGGWIDFSSVPKKGTTFTVFLPIAADEADSDDEDSSARRDESPFQNALIVDDDPVQTAMLEYYLKEDGCDTTVARDVGEASRANSGKEFDLAVIHQTSKEATLAKLCEDVRDKWPAAKTLVIGGGEDSLAGDSLLPKPFTSQDFYQAIDKLAQAR